MKHTIKIVTALLALSAIIGSFGMAGAAGANYETTYVGNATEMGVNSSQTYDSIQNASDNVAENGSVVIQTGNYTISEEITIQENNVTYQANTDSVTIDVNTTSGYAFNASNVETFEVGENVTISGDVFAGGGSGGSGDTGSSLETKYYGFPLWAYLLGILVVLALLYEYGER